MEFNFEQNEQDIESTLAFALSKDGKSVGVAWAKSPMSVSNAVQVLGYAALNALYSSRKGVPYVERRDEVHKLIRLFASELNADPSQAIWRKAADEVPKEQNRKIIFTLKEAGFPKRKILEGEFYYLEGKAFFSNGIKYSLPEVAYWAYAPEPPMENED